MIAIDTVRPTAATIAAKLVVAGPGALMSCDLARVNGISAVGGKPRKSHPINRGINMMVPISKRAIAA